MEGLALVGLLAALLVALHVAVAAYLYRAALSADGRDSARVRADDGPAPSADSRLDPAADATTCPGCGAPNDPDYRFCRRCVADLSGGQSASDGVAAGRLGS